MTNGEARIEDALAAPRAMIVVIDDEPNMCRILEKTLRLERYAVVSYTDPREALGKLGEQKPDVVLTDLLMPGVDGMEVVEAVRRYDSSIPSIVITAHGSIGGAVEAIKAGAFDYVTKPFLTDELLLTIAQALEFRRLHEERVSVDELWRRAQDQGDTVGESKSWREVMDLVARVAPTPSAVLIRGETGVGKELVARAVHRQSRASAGRFIPINCAAIPHELLESELFGHEKGAFTGAEARKLGRIELADRGTLFLDEVAEMPLALQAKILRVLQDQRIQRLGGTREIQVDTRIVAATHRDLERERETGRFRSDLYYRLNVIVIPIPPLRERIEDIPPLARHFIRQFCAQTRKKAPRLTDAAMDVLRAYSWPGNARELRNVIERHLVLSNDETVDADSLRSSLGHAAGGAIPPAAASLEAVTYQDARDRFEREFVVALLKRAGGNVTAAAKAAGMSRRNLYEKIERLGIKVADSKEPGPGNSQVS